MSSMSEHQFQLSKFPLKVIWITYLPGSLVALFQHFWQFQFQKHTYKLLPKKFGFPPVGPGCPPPIRKMSANFVTFLLWWLPLPQQPCSQTLSSFCRCHPPPLLPEHEKYCIDAHACKLHTYITLYNYIYMHIYMFAYFDCHHHD